VQLSDLIKPSEITLSGKANGALGSAFGKGNIKLLPNKFEGTDLTYSYQVQISGKIAAVGGRFLNTASKIIIKQFFEALAKETSPHKKRFNILLYFFKLFGKIK